MLLDHPQNFCSPRLDLVTVFADYPKCDPLKRSQSAFHNGGRPPACIIMTPAHSNDYAIKQDSLEFPAAAIHTAPAVASVRVPEGSSNWAAAGTCERDDFVVGLKVGRRSVCAVSSPIPFRYVCQCICDDIMHCRLRRYRPYILCSSGSALRWMRHFQT
jgi:hypothetical protein